MGNPVGPYERGDDCLICLAAGTTPKYVSVAFSGTRHDGHYVLPQVDNCAWGIHEAPAGLNIDYESAPGVSHVTGVDAIGTWFYRSDPVCQIEFWDGFRNAWAYVWWGVHPAVGGMIGSGYLWSGPGSRYEALYRGDNKWTFGLRNIRVPGNILVQYEP